MLPAYLPSWIQSFPGTLMMTTVSQGVGSQVALVALFLILGIVGVLLASRSGIAGRAASGQDRAVDAIVYERSNIPLQLDIIRMSLPPSAKSLPPVQIQPRRVMVVDDSTLVRTKLSRLLSGAGYVVIEAGDGQQAWDLLQSGDMPAVIITDLEMPVLNGFELVAAVHDAIETEHIPIIAITGREDLRAQVADLSGIYGIFKKPWNDRALIRRVEALVAMNAATSHAPAREAATADVG